MKKIMFSTELGLEQAVLDGRKTMTRRFVPEEVNEFLKTSSKAVLVIGNEIAPTEEDVERIKTHWMCGGSLPQGVKEIKGEISPEFVKLVIKKFSRYKVGEKIAVAQRYQDLKAVAPPELCEKLAAYSGSKGWDNKMYVKASEMQHFIEITNIRLEPVQDISDEDCIQEGIYSHTVWSGSAYDMPLTSYSYNAKKDHDVKRWWYNNPRAAFAALIDKLYGKDTWNSNPFTFVYEFKLIK